MSELIDLKRYYINPNKIKNPFIFVDSWIKYIFCAEISDEAKYIFWACVSREVFHVEQYFFNIVKIGSINLHQRTMIIVPTRPAAGKLYGDFEAYLGDFLYKNEDGNVKERVGGNVPWEDDITIGKKTWYF